MFLFHIKLFITMGPLGQSSYPLQIVSLIPIFLLSWGPKHAYVNVHRHPGNEWHVQTVP